MFVKLQGETPILYFDAISFPVNVNSKTVIRSLDNMYSGYSKLRFHPQNDQDLFSPLKTYFSPLVYSYANREYLTKYNRFYTA